MARAMKNSGVVWIGKVPEHWASLRIKDVCRAYNGHSAISANRYVGLEHITPWLGNYHAVDRAEAEASTGQSIAAGVMCFSKLRPYLAKAFVANEALFVTTELLTFIPRRAVIDAEFLTRYVLTPGFIAEVNDAVAGTKMPRVDWQTLSTQTIFLPPISEQRAIVDYLDQQTALIDQRLSTLEEKKAVLDELRKAIINEAVTKGSKWNADTGQVENLPTGWEMLRIKDVAELRSGNFIAAEKIEPAGAFPVFGGNGLRGFAESFTHNGEFALVGRQGALCGNVNYATGKFWATEHAVVVRHKRKMAVRWLGEMLCCMNLNQYATASAQPGLSVEVLVNKFLPFPPHDEQQAIANHLDQQTQQIDAQLATLDEQAQVLKELRKAIIHEAVTGKIDLSGTPERGGCGAVEKEGVIAL